MLRVNGYGGLFLVNLEYITETMKIGPIIVKPFAAIAWMMK